MNSPKSLVGPRCLYGDAVSTRANWRRVLDLALAAGEWRFDSPEGDPIPLRSVSGKIIISDSLQLTARRAEHWRLLWVGLLWRTHLGLPPRTIDLATVALQRKLILLGMRECWFAVGMLFPDLSAPAFSRTPDFIDGFARPLLRCYLAHLAEMVELEDRFVFGTSVDLMPFHGIHAPNSSLFPWSNIFQLAHQCAHAPPLRTMLDLLAHQYNGLIIDALLGEGIVEASSGGYILRGTV